MATKRLLGTITIVIILLGCSTGSVWAQPDFSTARVIEDVVIYNDASKAHRFYYGPGDLALAVTAAGQPDLQLVSMRYTGTEAAGDKGITRFRNLLRLRVVMEARTANQLQRIKRRLESNTPRVVLLPLPVYKMETSVVYAAIGSGDASSVSLTSGNNDGRFEADSPNGFNSEAGYWKERMYTLQLDDETTQALVSAFQKNQVMLSVAYAYFAKGIAEPASSLTFAGDAQLVADLKETFEPLADSVTQTKTIESRLIKADAFEVQADLSKWPEMVKQIDINDRAPSGYGALEIYCFDFDNDLAPNLFARRVEVEATTVGGRKVRLSTTFRSNQPDIFVQTLRFKQVLRLDKPYRFRTIDFTLEGDRTRSVWEMRYDWSEVLDVTSEAVN